MKRIIAPTLVSLLGCSALFAADSTADAVKAAITKLKGQPNYSWTAKMEMPGSQFTPGATEGKTEKDGFTVISQEMRDTTVQAVFKGEKACVKVEDEWKLASELEQAEGNRGTWMARMLARARGPVDDASDLLGKVKALKAGEGGLYSGDLTEEGAKELLTFGRRRPGADNAPPPPKNAKGSAKFWVKDGTLVKFESNLEGTMTIRDEERDVKRIRTIEIKSIGTTKVEVPAEAKKKLSS